MFGGIFVQDFDRRFRVFDQQRSGIFERGGGKRAARLCGATKVFKTGGAQAVGAMAFGTESVPRCYKIFGPGNRFVTEAKMQVSLEGTAIDMPAGTYNPTFSIGTDLRQQKTPFVVSTTAGASICAA